MSKGIFIPDITVEMIRKAPLEAIETLLVEGEMYDVDMPKWIPCSERLPSEGEYVLVTEKWHGYVWMWRLQYIDNEPTWEADGYNVDIDEAVAWMPLPPVYQGE